MASERTLLFLGGFTLLLELIVNLDLISGDKVVRFVSHAYNRHQFREHGVRHALLLGCGGVSCDAIATPVRGAHGDVDQFLGERIDTEPWFLLIKHWTFRLYLRDRAQVRSNKSDCELFWVMVPCLPTISSAKISVTYG